MPTEVAALLWASPVPYFHLVFKSCLRVLSGASQTKTVTLSEGLPCVRLFICIASQMTLEIGAIISPFADDETEDGKLSSCSGSES